MKTPYEPRAKRQVESSPRKAGTDTKPIRPKVGHTGPDAGKLGSRSGNPPGIRPSGTKPDPRRDTGRQIDKPHRIVAKIIPGPLPEGCRVKVVETEEEVVFLHECTDYRARQIRAGAFDDQADTLRTAVAQSVRAKLEVANPRWLEPDAG